MQRAHRVRGKVVLITGASGGLGEQVAYAAAKRGAVVVATARRVERLQAGQERGREPSGRDRLRPCSRGYRTPAGQGGAAEGRYRCGSG